MLKFQSNIYKKSVTFWNISKSKYSVRCNSTLLRENTSQDKTDSYPPVADFYAGKSVFLTGGTGFLGKVFVHISTAYAHSNNQTLAETLYPPPAEVREVYKFIGKHGHDKKETKKFIGERPNTYTFTKALTESYIAENNGGVPTIIIRPSIVAPIKEEPLKGWLDNWFGATMLLHTIGMGLNRVVLGEKSHTLDLIPANYVCNLTILAAARHKRSKVTEVFNCCTSSENPITLSDSFQYLIQANTASGQRGGTIKSWLSIFPDAVSYPFVIHTKSTIALKILTIIFQKTPAHIADLFLRIRGREPKYVKLQSKAIDSRDSVQYFTARTWDMKSAKARELSSTLSHEDKRQFPCDPTQIRWGEYMHEYCHGIHKYLMS